MIHVIEIPKVRDYEGGEVKVVAMNPLGKIEAVTSLQVIPKDDWRSRLKQAPKCKHPFYYLTTKIIIASTYIVAS